MTDHAAPDENLSPTAPDELITWLRGLPVRTVLLDKHQRAWQVGQTRPGTCLMLVNFSSPFLCGDDSDMAEVCRNAPFRILWTIGRVR
jgi:hypothetical protein